MWLELAREGYEPLKRFAATTLLPNILVHYNLSINDNEQLKRLIYWRYFDRIPEKTSYMLNTMQRLISETKFETPFLETLDRLTDTDNLNISFITKNHIANVESVVQRKAKKQIYVYSLHNSKSIDIRGFVNYFGGSSHTSDFLFLMGPSLFQQVSRRKLTSAEMRLCRKIRYSFTEFIKTGNPAGIHLSTVWHPYTNNRKFIHILSDKNGICDSTDAMLGPCDQNGMFMSTVEKHFVEIDEMIHGKARVVSSSILNPFQIGKENLPNNPIDSARMSKSYLGLPYSESEYYNALRKTHSFWMELLPEIVLDNNYYRDYSNGIYARSNFNDPLYISIMAASGTKFKHAFFSMLILVCLLLGVLCICMYILKRNQQNVGANFL